MTTISTFFEKYTKYLIFLSALAVSIALVLCVAFLYFYMQKTTKQLSEEVIYRLENREINSKIIEIHKLVLENQDNAPIPMNRFLIRYAKRYIYYCLIKKIIGKKMFCEVKINKKRVSAIICNFIEYKDFMKQNIKNILSINNEYFAQSLEFSTHSLTGKSYYLYKYEHLPFRFLGIDFEGRNDEYLRTLFRLMKGLQYLYKENYIFLNFNYSNIAGNILDFFRVTFKIILDVNLYKIDSVENYKYQPFEIDLSHTAPELVYKQRIKSNHDVYALGCIAYYLLIDYPKVESDKKKKILSNICEDCKLDPKEPFFSFLNFENCVLCDDCLKNNADIECIYCRPSSEFYSCKKCVGSKENLQVQIFTVRKFKQMTLYDHPITWEGDKNIEEFINVCLQNADNRPNINELINMDVTKKLFKVLWNEF